MSADLSSDPIETDVAESNIAELDFAIDLTETEDLDIPESASEKPFSSRQKPNA